jgi:signal transduction histidine kinase
MDTYESAFSARRTFEIEYRLRREDGEYRWILDYGAPRFAPDGTFAGYIGSCVDITERKLYEDELRKAVRDRDDFLSIASHELRTPLTTLQLQLESLLRTLARRPDEALASGRIADNAVKAKRQAEVLTDRVAELFDMSRIASGRLELELTEIDLSALVEEACDRFAPAFAAAECALARSIKPGVCGRWDRRLLDRALVNILSNAVKYGRGKPIDVGVDEEGELALIVVRDRGIGIAAADRERIFERFERAVSSSHYGGLGLGLWIAREVVRAFRGTIRLESEPGFGAEFTLELPLTPSGRAE